MNEQTELTNAVRSAYEIHANRPTINPAWLATEAMIVIDFPRTLHPIGYLGCHLQMRQIARSFCRQHFDPQETVENDLFPDSLQQRYPRAPQDTQEDPEYVLIDGMEQRDVAYNVARLRKEAAAKQRHADALEAWGQNRFGKSVA